MTVTTTVIVGFSADDVTTPKNHPQVVIRDLTLIASTVGGRHEQADAWEALAATAVILAARLRAPVCDLCGAVATGTIDVTGPDAPVTLAHCQTHEGDILDQAAALQQQIDADAFATVVSS